MVEEQLLLSSSEGLWEEFALDDWSYNAVCKDGGYFLQIWLYKVLNMVEIKFSISRDYMT